MGKIHDPIQLPYTVSVSENDIQTVGCLSAKNDASEHSETIRRSRLNTITNNLIRVTELYLQGVTVFFISKVTAQKY